MASIPDGLGIFNPAFPYNWSEDGLFNQTADFLQHLQQCLHLYCESELLDLLITALIGSASAWFDDQPKFTSLHDFDIALTKAFPLSESVTISSIPISSESPTPPKQQKLEVTSEAPKIAKRVGFKKASKAEQAAKSTSTLQNIGIFDPALASDEFEFGLYSEAAVFLQHLQQCRHLYRKSDLLDLLPKCLCGLASEWFKTQFEFTSLKRFSKALAKAFSPAETSSRRTPPKRLNFQLNAPDVVSESTESASGQQAAEATCKLCKQSFNSNNELYEHIRKHEALKPAEDSHLSINAVNLVYETEERSPASPEPTSRPATPRKQISESAPASRTVTLLKRSSLPPLTLETVPKSMGNTSMQCLIAPPPPHVPQTPAQKHQYVDVQKHSTVNSLLLIDAAKPTCKNEEKPAVDDSPSAPAPQESDTSTATSRQIFESTLTPEIVTSQGSTRLPVHTPETVSESEENKSAQCPSTSPKPSPRTFESDLQEIPAQEPQKIGVQKRSIVSSLLSIDTANSTCEAEERSAIACPPPPLQPPTPTATPNRIFDSALTPEVVTSQGSPHLSDHTSKTVPKSKENESTQCSSTSSEPTTEWLAAFRKQAARIRVRLEAERTALQLSALESAPKSMETPSIQQTVCARICRRCKQSFNSNNKLHEHIREHHARKPVQSLNLRAPAPEPTCKTKEKPAFTCPSAPLAPQKPPTPPATPRSQISSAEIASQSLSPKCSNLSIATHKTPSKSEEKLSVSCPLTPPLSPSRTPVPKQQEPHIQKSYLTASDLSRMFAGKSRPFGLRQHHNRRPSQQGSDIRQYAPPPTPPATPTSISEPVSPECSHLPIATLNITPKSMEKLPANCSLTPPASPPRTPVPKHQKPYLTVDDLVRMFRGKPRPFGLRQYQEGPASPQCFGTNPPRQPRSLLHQSRITSYFVPAANQKVPISQSLKSPKPRSFQQHTPAEPTRTAPAPAPALPEKSTKLPYKMPDVSGGGPSFISILLRLVPAFLLALAFVSAISAARMGCITTYQQAVSAIGRAIQ